MKLILTAEPLQKHASCLVHQVIHSFILLGLDLLFASEHCHQTSTGCCAAALHLKTCRACADKSAATSSMQTPNGFRAVSPEAPVTPANPSETFPQHSTSASSPSNISTEACLASQRDPAAQTAGADHDESTSPTSTGSPSHERVPSADQSADGSLPSLDPQAESDPAATAASASGSLSESNDEAGPNPKAEVEEVLRMALAWLRRADPYGFPAAGGNSEQGAAGRPPAGHKVGYLLSGDCFDFDPIYRFVVITASLLCS